MIEVQVRENDRVDRIRPNTSRYQVCDKSMVSLRHTKTIAKLWLEERPNARLEEHTTPVVELDEESTASELDAVTRIRRGPALPERAGCVAVHGATVEALAVSVDREKAHASSLDHVRSDVTRGSRVRRA